MSTEELFAEAKRQLDICNSCRYCEGYCPVWPAIEVRVDMRPEEVVHLANLCHDCRDCYTACMYTPPHVFDLNPPKVFSDVREYTYRHYVWPANPPRFLRGKAGVAVFGAVVAAILVVLAIVTDAGALFNTDHRGSPYGVVAYIPLVVAASLPFLFSVVVLLRAIGKYWRDIEGSARALFHLKGWLISLSYVARLAHYSGGGEGCSYQNNEPSLVRKWMHQLLMYGFLLCFVATIAAFVLQDVFFIMPPYAWYSVPVVSGSVGGALAIIGCLGLLVLKAKADDTQLSPEMARSDNALLWTMLALMITGFATTFTRATPAFGLVLIVHLTAVIVFFGLMPYTKFVHWVYRVLSVQKDTVERLDQERARASA